MRERCILSHPLLVLGQAVSTGQRWRMKPLLLKELFLPSFTLLLPPVVAGWRENFLLVRGMEQFLSLVRSLVHVSCIWSLLVFIVLCMTAVRFSILENVLPIFLDKCWLLSPSCKINAQGELNICGCWVGSSLFQTNVFYPSKAFCVRRGQANLESMVI